MSNAYRLPERLGGLVGDELARVGGAPSGDAATLSARWASAVGDAIARNAWPARMTRDGTLVVHASSSTWVQELTQLEASVRERLGDAAPPRIRFVVGPVPASGAEPEPDVQRSTHSPTDREQALGAEIAGEIEDPGLRDVIARACALSLAAARDVGRRRPV